MYVIANAFSINMLNSDATISFRKISLDDVKEILKSNEFKSVVGHPATAQFLSELIGVEIEANREMYKMFHSCLFTGINQSFGVIYCLLPCNSPFGKTYPVGIHKCIYAI